MRSIPTRVIAGALAVTTGVEGRDGVPGLGTPLLLVGVAFDGSLGLLFLAWVLPRLGRSTS